MKETHALWQNERRVIYRMFLYLLHKSDLYRRIGYHHTGSHTALQGSVADPDPVFLGHPDPDPNPGKYRIRILYLIQIFSRKIVKNTISSK